MYKCIENLKYFSKRNSAKKKCQKSHTLNIYDIIMLKGIVQLTVNYILIIPIYI